MKNSTKQPIPPADMNFREQCPQEDKKRQKRELSNLVGYRRAQLEQQKDQARKAKEQNN